MSHSNRTLLVLPLLLLGFIACEGGVDETPDGQGDGDASGGTGPGGHTNNGDGDGDGDAGDGDTGDGDSGDGDGDQSEPRCGVDEAPGARLANPTDEGSGDCADVSIADFLARIHEAHPDLSDVTDMRNEDAGGEQERSYIGFKKDDGRLQAVLYQGAGDCPSGCIDDIYHYFEADESCDPVLVGSYENVSDEENNCRNITGAPKWGYPVATPTTYSCEVRDTPTIEGTFSIPFSGTRQPCSLKGSDTPEDISGTLELTISASKDDPSQAVITLESPDFDLPWLESTELATMIEYLQYRVETQWDNTPTTCLESYDVSIDLDLEVCFSGHLRYEEAIDTECNDDYCKGTADFDLDLSALRDAITSR